MGEGLLVPRGRLELPHPNGYQRLKCSARASLRWRAKPHPLRDWFESLQVHEVGELGELMVPRGRLELGRNSVSTSPRVARSRTHSVIRIIS